MHEKQALITGSFDPITKGHLALIERAALLFDHLYISVTHNTQKQSYFSLSLRTKWVQQVTGHLNVTVVQNTDQLTADIAKALGVTCCIRGIRNTQDFIYEQNLANILHTYPPYLETLCLFTEPEYQMISSSLVRELLYYQGDIRSYVPEALVQDIYDAYAQNKKE